MRLGHAIYCSCAAVFAVLHNLPKAFIGIDAVIQALLDDLLHEDPGFDKSMVMRGAGDGSVGLVSC